MGDRERLVTALESVVELLQQRTTDVSGTVYLSAQQPVADISQPLWHIRRDRFVKLRFLALMFDADGPLRRIARLNGWEPAFEEARAGFASAFEALHRVRYFRTETPVELGDRIRFRHLLVRRSGRVVYVPGVSPPRAEIDFGGLLNVGVQIEGGTFTTCHVDPEAVELGKHVSFERRDPDGIPEAPTDEELRE